MRSGLLRVGSECPHPPAPSPGVPGEGEMLYKEKSTLYKPSPAADGRGCASLRCAGEGALSFVEQVMCGIHKKSLCKITP
jgi:hypothetical protein